MFFRKFAIYYFLGVWGTLGDFAAARGPEQANNAKFVCMRNAYPVNPVWGAMCPWGPRYGRSGGGLGAISSVDRRFCLLGTQPTKNRFGRNSAPRDLSRMFWVVGTAFVLRSLRNEFFGKLAIHWLGDLEKFRDPVRGPKRA